MIDDADPAITLVAEPLLVDSHGAARMCGVAERTWRKLDRQGHVPRAVSIGRRRLWAVASLRKWTELGCPARHELEMRRGAE